MILAIVIKEFENYFEKMVPLTDLIVAESYLAEEKTGNYILDLVKLSEKYNMPFASDIAIIRAKVHTYTPEEGERPATRNGRRKKNKFLIDCLTEAKCCVDNYFANSRKLLEESSVLLRKLAAVALSKGIFLNDNIDIDDIMDKIRHDAELMPALTSAIGTVGALNTKYLLENAVEEVIQQY
jgi:hypothetical protein